MCEHLKIKLDVDPKLTPQTHPPRPSRSVLALSNRAMAHLKLQRLDPAIQDATAALTLDPTHSKSLERRAAALAGRGRHHEARRDLEACVRLRPEDSVLRAKLRRLSQETEAAANE